VKLIAVVAHAEKELDGGLCELRRLLEAEVRCELDGGDRSKVKSFKVRVEPRVLRVRAPRPGQEKS
jgi:hypothetical protein